MRKLLIGALAGIALGWIASSSDAAPLVVYSNDFDGSVTCAAGSCSGAGGFPSASPFGGSGIAFIGSDPSGLSLTLTGLPAHSSVSADFLANLEATWDGLNCCPDVIHITLGGTPVYRGVIGGTHFSIDFGGTDYDLDVPGSQDIPPAVDLGDRRLDFGAEPKLDAMPHSAASLVFRVVCADTAGTPAGGGCQSDDTFLMDNLTVTIDTVTTPPPPPPPSGVPAPATVILLGLGLAALGGWRLRRS